MKYKVILFYKYIEITDTESFMADQKAFCALHGLRGRILIATEGFNGTIEGEVSEVDAYVEWMRTNTQYDLSDVDFKESLSDGDSFPKMKVKVKPEIVNLGLGEEDFLPSECTGEYLNPDQLHDLMKSGEEHYIIDMRNKHEFDIGRFEGSIDPGMKYFRNLPDVMDKIEDLKDKKVVTVCTGGIRCEKASGYLKKKGFTDVSQLEGGMHRYIEKYGGDGWEGSLYVFDKRKVIRPETGHTIVGKCALCESPDETYRDCTNNICGNHFIACDDCLGEDGNPYCSKECEKVISEQKVVS